MNEEKQLSLVAGSVNNEDTKVWSGPEKKMYKQMAKKEHLLPYPLETITLPNGEEDTLYVIDNEEDRVREAKRLWPFNSDVDADTELFDIHCNRKCTFKQVRILRYGEYNMIVSPYYAQAGGTVLDLVMKSQMLDLDDTMICTGILKKSNLETEN